MNQAGKPEVGNIIYLLDANTNALMPVEVVEEITHRTYAGVEVFHVIKTPLGKSMRLEDAKVPYFLDIDSAKSFLLDTASKIVEVAIQKALKESQVFEKKKKSNDKQTNEQDIRIDLGNGQTANFKLNLPQENF